ncbi:energy-coupling factor transporter transmembrane component T family protein [Clostridium thermarum]|uniref:energy-coupling factor transporter transmembrane component T family protein n=1 Tax=Clostridium thermarum TaxID=1716543 RepID=UPI0011224316|nr:energy-coupling factor transporter transmembrane component T [Clostridium thermarum]
MEQLQVKKPIYPLLSLFISMFIFFFGLFLAKDISLIYFLFALTIIYIVFGFGKVLMKAVPMFFAIGSIVGTLSALTSGNVIGGFQTLGRVILLAYSSVIMVSMSPIFLTRNLVQLGFPRVITLGMLATIRFVPMLLSEAKQICEAMKTRGVSLSIRKPFIVYRAFIIPFLMRMISMSDIMTVSVETRGFALNDKSKVVYKRVDFTLKDGLFATLILLTMVGVLVL